MRKTGRSVTSFDVAALAGVSQSAVSRAFTPNARIAAETRARVLEAARKLNYVPNSIARSLTTRRTNIVALVLGNPENPFYMHVLNAFSRRLQEMGRQVLIFTVERGDSSDQAIMNVLKHQVDAVIVTSSHLSSRATTLCHDRDIPVVLFNRTSSAPETPCVRCDNAGGAGLIARAFLKAGARSFAVITGDKAGSTSADRVRGFRDSLIEAGVSPADIREYDGFATYDGGAAAARQILADGLPDAIFGVADIMAMATIDELSISSGLTIPKDVMIAGFDNIPEAARLPYRLTSVEQPIEAMVEETIRQLNLDGASGDYAAGTQGEVDIQIPGTLIWRETILGGE